MKMPWTSYDDYPASGNIPMLSICVLLEVFHGKEKTMPDSNIPIDKLRAVSETMAELIEEAMAVKIHFQKKETLRDWPAIEKLIHKTELRLTIGEAFDTRDDLLRLAEENEELREEDCKLRIEYSKLKDKYCDATTGKSKT